MSADSRIDLGLPRATKVLIERAATIENTSVSEFVVSNALRHAEHLAAIEILTAPTKRRRIAK